jgi:hypothetical protein
MRKAAIDGPKIQPAFAGAPSPFSAKRIVPPIGKYVYTNKVGRLYK